MDKTSQFVNNAISIHGAKYDYSLVNYINAKTKVVIKCKEHGEFLQIPRKHISGQQCPKCAASFANDYRKLTTTDFIERARQIHADKYDYSESCYVNSTTKIKILCPKHGSFYQFPHAHTNGHGCRKCSVFSQKQSKFPKKNEAFSAVKWLQKLKAKNPSIIFGEITSDYIDGHCIKHGKITKHKSEWLRSGCKLCSYEKMSSENAMNPDDFISKSLKIHRNYYSYSSVNYINNNTKVKIICPDHGSFKITPKHHLRGQGCPSCSVSSGQTALYNFISERHSGTVILNDRQVLKPYEIDIYVPDLSFGLEFHGIYFHSYDRNESTQEKNRHKTKADLAKNIDLYQIFEHEYTQKFDIVQSMIENKLKLSESVMARKLNVVELDNKTYRTLINQWHLSGYKHADFKLALEKNGEIFAILSISKHRKYQWEIARFASRLGYNVQGGFQKLLKYFIRKCNPSTIMTFADRRYSNGNCYLKSNFKLIDVTKPNYFYVRGNSVYSRQKFQKHKLSGTIDVFDPNLTEPQNMFNNGYRRLWDAGHLKLLWCNNETTANTLVSS